MNLNLAKNMVFKLLRILKLDSEFIYFRGRIKLIFDINTPLEEETPWQKNLITTAMKVAILNQLRNQGAASNPGIITYGVVGTNTTPPAVGDTTLGTEIERAAVSYTQLTGTTAEIRVFFTTTEAIGSLREFGWFGEAATGAADSGTMFNHVAINREKTAVKTLTIVQEFTW